MVSWALHLHILGMLEPKPARDLLGLMEISVAAVARSPRPSSPFMEAEPSWSTCSNTAGKGPSPTGVDGARPRTVEVGSVELVSGHLWARNSTCNGRFRRALIGH